MKKLTVCIAALLFACWSSANSKIPTGHLVAWHPSSDPFYYLEVGFNGSVNPVVLYSRSTFKDFPESFALLLMYRQDFAAYLAASFLRKNREYSKPSGVWVLPNGAKVTQWGYVGIDESVVYSLPELKNKRGEALTCFAYNRLSADQRTSLRKSVIQPRSKLTLVPTHELFTADGLAFVESDECRSLFESLPTDAR